MNFLKVNPNIFILDGERCKTKDGLFNEFSKVFHFPDYFSNNWDSFEELMNDLSWIPNGKITAILLYPQEILIKENVQEKEILEDILLSIDPIEKHIDWQTVSLKE